MSGAVEFLVPKVSGGARVTFYASDALFALYRVIVTARIRGPRFAIVSHLSSPVIGRIIEDYEAEPDE